MAECPICGLGELCRNHWIASQDASGELHFQTGPMTASDDNLILLQNKLGRPELKGMMEKIGLQPEWVESGGRSMAYLAWPLDLRAAVNRALFPAGPPGGESPIPEVPKHRHTLEDIGVGEVQFDLENCLPDELLYHVQFHLHLAELGTVFFTYSQVLWDELIPWSDLMRLPEVSERARRTLVLVFAGLLDPLRQTFAGQPVDVLAEDQPDRLAPGARVDEVARVAPPDAHLGEEIERLVNERRIQPALRTAVGGFAMSAKL
ncbi:MAG: hypothetical protein ACRD2E_13640 [Terriglobales bacterium]